MRKTCVAEYSSFTGWCDKRYGFSSFQCRDIVSDYFSGSYTHEFFPLDCLPNIAELNIYGDDETPEAIQKAKDFIVNYDAKNNPLSLENIDLTIVMMNAYVIAESMEDEAPILFILQ